MKTIIKEKLEFTPERIPVEIKGTLNQFISLWGGDINSCLAYMKTINEGLAVKYFYTAIPKDYDRVSIYGLKPDLINIQAESIGVTSILKRINQDNYEHYLIESLQELNDIDGMVFKSIEMQDEIDLQEYLEWGNYICRRAGIRSYFPLWKIDQRQLLQEFIEEGFKAIIIAVNSRFFSPGTLGREIDENWVKELDRLGNVNYCATENEYYTMAYDGPIYIKKIKINQDRKFRRGNYWLLDISASCKDSK